MAQGVRKISDGALVEKRGEKLDEMRELEWKHDIPVEWISKRKEHDLWQTSETTNVEKVKPFREKNTTPMNEVENTPLENRDIEHCEKTLKLKGKIYIETTPVKTR